MSDGAPAPADVEQALLTFAERLGSFAETLPVRDRHLLETLLMRAAPPLERVRWAATLTPEEAALVDRLAADEQG